MPAVGETLAGRYHVDRLLGAGGMAVVYRAHDARLDRDVAIKLLLPALAADPLVAERFEREARSLAAINHPNVVAVFDVEPDDPAAGRDPFFVMELCEGGSLADRLAVAGGLLPPDELVPIVVEAADGLAALHAAGIVHRDVKPQNVLLSTGRTKLGDLGIAVGAGAASSLTTSGSAIGTLSYLAPERLAGEPATYASDVWSLGALVYGGLTGAPPRRDASLADLADHRLEPPVPASMVAPGLGTQFDGVLASALDPVPDRRPTALAFATALAGALGRWARAGGPTRAGVAAAAAAARPPDFAATVDPLPMPQAAIAADATTMSVAALATPARSRSGTVDPGEGRTRSAGPARVANGPVIVAVLVLAGVAGLVFGALLTNRGGGGPGLGTAAPSAAIVIPPSPSPSVAPSATPSPTPTATPTPTPVPTPTPDPLADARARLDDVRQAIADAKGGKDGLKGRDADRLTGLADAVDSAIAAGDAGQAASAADALVGAVQDDLDQERIGGDRGQALLDAATALRDALPSD